MISRMGRLIKIRLSSRVRMFPAIRKVIKLRTLKNNCEPYTECSRDLLSFITKISNHLHYSREMS